MALSGKTVIVTGGNRGIGFDVCRKLAHAGNNVILCSRNIEAGLGLGPAFTVLRHLFVTDITGTAFRTIPTAQFPREFEVITFDLLTHQPLKLIPAPVGDLHPQ